MRGFALSACVAGSVALFWASAASATNLVTNGNFASFSGPAAGGQLGFAGNAATDWSVPSLNSSYVFLFTPKGGNTSGTDADGPGVTGEYGNLQLWGPDNGSSNGLTEPPGGGNFIGSDPAFQNGAISQTINGLTPGQQYVLTFDWAGAEQYLHNDPTSEGWQVSLGSQTFDTPTVSIGNHGFSGWQTGDFTFTATSSSEVLSFLATGAGTAAQPPFALLDDVSLTAQVPEPATWTMMLLGVGALGAALRMRRREVFAAA